jgi:hypothetical protein
MTTFATVTAAQPIPALGEIAILKARQAALLRQLSELDAIQAGAPLEIFDELASIEIALQRYDGGIGDDTADQIADARRAARFGCGL